MPASTLSTSARGASFLILIQLGSRALTFIINQMLLRYSSPVYLGVSTQLELYTITVLYFSRESLRVALQRPTSNTQAAVNIAYVPVALGVPLCAVLGVLYARAPSLPNIPLITNALSVCAAATVVELASEPAFAVAQQKQLYGKRAVAEAAGAVTRAVVNYALVVYFYQQGRNMGVLPFSLGLLAGNIALSGAYIVQMRRVAHCDGFSLLPRQISPEPKEKDADDSKERRKPAGLLASYLSRDLGTLGVNLYLQSAVKYILTQGDSILIASLSTLHDQGTYALAANYGGLIARIIFQPIEESSRNLFAKLCVQPDKSSSPDNSKSKPKPKPKPGLASTTTTWQQQQQQAATLLETALRLYMILALLSWTLGPHLAPHALRLLAGPRWSGGGAAPVVAAYTYYIPIQALNGVSEAFVAAVAGAGELRAQSAFLGANSAVFAGAAWLFVARAGLGAPGLVWACCVALAARAAWSVRFAARWFAARGVRFEAARAAPGVGCLAAAGGAVAVLRSGRAVVAATGVEVWDEVLGVVGVGALLGVAFVVLEWSFWMRLYEMVVGGGVGGEGEAVQRKGEAGSRDRVDASVKL